jgi:F0F1-type ATP synthase assembly protein I
MKKIYRHALKVFIYQLLIILLPLLALAIPGRLLDKQLGTSPRYLLIAVIISLVITVVLSFVLTRRITAKLNKMGEKGGSKSKDLPPDDHDEPSSLI